jgi:hypothetical protein
MTAPEPKDGAEAELLARSRRLDPHQLRMFVEALSLFADGAPITCFLDFAVAMGWSRAAARKKLRDIDDAGTSAPDWRNALN